MSAICAHTVRVMYILVFAWSSSSYSIVTVAQLHNERSFGCISADKWDECRFSSEFWVVDKWIWNCKFAMMSAHTAAHSQMCWKYDDRRHEDISRSDYSYLWNMYYAFHLCDRMPFRYNITHTQMQRDSVSRFFFIVTELFFALEYIALQPIQPTSATNLSL